MITSYATLQSSIADFLHRTDLTALIPAFIADGEERIYETLRIRAMEAAFSDVIASGTVALPASFIEWKYLYIDGTSAQKIERKDPEFIYANYPTRSSSGKPVFFAREAETLIFGPYPNDAYTVKGAYYKRLPALSDTNTTNWLITNAPDVLRYAALCEASIYTLDDKMLGDCEGKFKSIMARLDRTDKREAFSGSSLTTSRR